MKTDYDVIVAGGGIAGIAAALASARSGAKTVLLEKEYALGGLATLGLIVIYLALDDGDGTLPIGQRVRHAVFGEGTVLDVDLNKGAHVIQFDGMGTPRSISLRAKLEKIGP